MYKNPVVLKHTGRTNIQKYKKNITVFIHIPKTAGTSIQDTLYKLYNKNDVFNLYSLENIINFATKYTGEKLILGHFKLYQEILQKIDASYKSFTFLREPVSRVLSQYNHMLKSNDPSHKEIIEKYDTLMKFIHLDGWGNNTMTHYLSSIDDFSRPEQMLASAKKNLEEKIAVIGIVERMQESLVSLQYNMGFPKIANKYINVSQKKYTQKELPEQEITAIRKKNHLDTQLYNFALDLFEKQLQSIPLFKLRLFFNKNK